jgi:hypothetical protein
MVIDDLDIRRSVRASRPYEADSPLHVDPDAELTGSIPLQGFEPIASQRAQFIQTARCVEYFEPSIGLSRKTLKFTNEMTVGERPGPCAPVGQDHYKAT